MRQTNWIPGAMILGIAASFGCGDRALPTEPAREVADVAKVSSPETGFSGNWSGTITFHAFESDAEVLPCDGTASIQVALRQVGGNLSGQFETACAGELEIRAALTGDRLSGLLDRSAGRTYGAISGTLLSGEIRFQTSKRIDKSREAVTAEVELHRVQLSRRIPPLVVSGGRSPREIAARR